MAVGNGLIQWSSGRRDWFDHIVGALLLDASAVSNPFAQSDASVSGVLDTTAAGVLSIAPTTATSVAIGKKISGLAGIVAAGALGVPVVVAQGRSAGAIAAVASVAAFTVGASDATFQVAANVLVTTATNHTFTVTCAYTDEGNTARTLTMPFVLVAGSAIVNSVANATGTVPYMGLPVSIRAKAATSITIATTGAFTTVVYNVDGTIKQVG